MGFYVRKSLSVGPLRFNLSKGGIGVSAGIKGFRVGGGPRGNYVHMGRAGLYFRKGLSPTPGAALLPALPPAPAHESPGELGVGPFVEIESADVSGLVDSSAEGLIEELNGKRKRRRRWPIVAVGTGPFLGLLNQGLPDWVPVVVLLVGVAATWATWQWDAVRKSTVLFYDADDTVVANFENLSSAFSELGTCKRLWHVSASAHVQDRKYHAGASNLIKRTATAVRLGQPPFVKTNIDAPLLQVGRQQLAFMPDRVLVFDHNGVGAVSYDDLEVTGVSTRFIEDGGAPADATVVGKTWRYVNRSGGPDKRFKDNKELPVCLYDEIALRSKTGLNECVHVSRSGAGEAFSSALGHYGGTLPALAGPPEGVR